MSSTDSLETVGDILRPENVTEEGHSAGREIFDMSEFGEPSDDLSDTDLPGVPPGDNDDAVG